MATGMTIVKRFTYRGDSTEEFSNTYFFTGTTPATSAAWTALFDALVAQEKTLYEPRVGAEALFARPVIVRGYGYDSDAAHRSAVWTRNLVPGSEVEGTFAAAANNAKPQGGDSAAWIRWKTSRLSRGKAVYVRKYYHPAYVGSSGGDAIIAAWRTVALAFAAKLWDGSFLDGRTITAPGHTDTILGANCSLYATTRTLKRRSKRLPT